MPGAPISQETDDPEVQVLLIFRQQIHSYSMLESGPKGHGQNECGKQWALPDGARENPESTVPSGCWHSLAHQGRRWSIQMPQKCKIILFFFINF